MIPVARTQLETSFVLPCKVPHTACTEASRNRSHARQRVLHLAQHHIGLAGGMQASTMGEARLNTVSLVSGVRHLSSSPTQYMPRSDGF